MKKLILILVLFTICITQMKSQDIVQWGKYTIIDSLDLSTIAGADTTIYVTVATEGKSPVWLTDIRWVTITGSGNIAIVVSVDGTNFYAYNSSPSATVSGASGNYQFKDDYLSFPYWGLKFTKGTISVGTLNATIYFKKL